MEEVKQPPDYPVTCPRCGVEYGPAQFGGEVGTHRPGSDACHRRVAARAGKDLVQLESQHRQLLIHNKRQSVLLGLAQKPAEPPPAPPEIERCHGLDLQGKRCGEGPHHVGGCRERHNG